jgi:ABC-2 type transport system ATP-binding protein
VVERLRKDYGRLPAVDGLSFQIRRGEIYAILGPNGAGKTTTVEILEGHRKRTSGSVQVLGFDPGAGGRQFRERIGIVLQSSGIDAELTVREMVALYASFYALPRDVGATIEQVGLASKRRARVRTLSGGQLRRLDLALAVVGDPELLFLDEPTTCFDPNARRDAWDMIAGLRDAGATILLTSHYLDEVQRLADRVAVMSHGHLVEESTPDALGGRDIASMVLAREEGILKRLRGAPLPAWTYLAGRFGSGLVTSLISVGVIIATAVVFFHVTIVWRAVSYFAAAADLGMACFFLLGVAVTTALPKSDTALPVAYGTVLPLAFISDVFFPSVHAPRWLYDAAGCGPGTAAAGPAHAVRCLPR